MNQTPYNFTAMFINYSKFFFIFLFLFFSGTILNSQNIVITLNSGSQEVYPLNEIRSIKFENDSMVIYHYDNSFLIWDVLDIDNYAFEESTQTEDFLDNKNESLEVFPNPASDVVNIVFKSQGM